MRAERLTERPRRAGPVPAYVDKGSKPFGPHRGAQGAPFQSDETR